MGKIKSGVFDMNSDCYIDYDIYYVSEFSYKYLNVKYCFFLRGIKNNCGKFSRKLDIIFYKKKKSFY